VQFERRSFPVETIEFEGIENVQDLANYTDAELDLMADRNSKRNLVNTCVQMGLPTTKASKAITHWVRKKLCKDSDCNQLELNQAMIAELINEMNGTKGKKYAEAVTDVRAWEKSTACC
jgi:hypothetical protein